MSSHAAVSLSHRFVGNVQTYCPSLRGQASVGWVLVRVRAQIRDLPTGLFGRRKDRHSGSRSPPCLLPGLAEDSLTMVTDVGVAHAVFFLVEVALELLELHLVLHKLGILLDPPQVPVRVLPRTIDLCERGACVWLHILHLHIRDVAHG